MPFWGQIGMQDSVSWTGDMLVSFHHYVMVFLVLIFSFVLYGVFSLVSNKFVCSGMLEEQKLETWWTVLPIFILMLLVVPSLRLLYLMDEVTEPQLTVKAIGKQWYWSYEYNDYGGIMFDSYMLKEDDLTEEKPFRLLEVDNRMVLPSKTNVRVIVTASDVMHSWTVPSFGVKVDAVPGRLNQVGVYVKSPGVFYGQCSEICGANHSFMPIVVEVHPQDEFIQMVEGVASS